MAVFGKQITTTKPDLATMFAAGGVKFLEENALAKTPIGNGTLLSGGSKIAIGLGAREFLSGGLIGNAVSLGFTMDGVEDILYALTKGAGFGSIISAGGNNSRPAWAC